MSIYLDHNATSPLHPQVLEAMMPYLREPVANASSLHSAGRLARAVVETAREQVAALIHCPVQSVIFTASGTEANNLLLKGFIDFDDDRPIVSSDIEHPSIIEPLKQLEQSGQKVVRLAVRSDGEVDLAAAHQLLSHCTPKLLSVVLANNETGVLQPVQQLSAMVTQSDCLKHTDATQVVGKLPVDMVQLGVDALTLSGHKLQGPQGIGVLAVQQNPRHVLISGGAQEKYRRAGTESVALIAGLGKAAEIAGIEMTQKSHHLLQLRDSLESRLLSIPGVVIFGQLAERLPNTTYFSIPYYHGETLLMMLDKAGFALASGSACHSEVTRMSHVLDAMGVEESLALNAVRVSLGVNNTMQDIDALFHKIEELVRNLPATIRRLAVE